jgi:hypothetical protein
MNWSGILVTISSCDRPPLWSSGQSSWLQIQRSRVRFPALQDFLSSSGSGMGSLSPMSTTEELFGRNNCSSSLETRKYSHNTLYPQKSGTNFANKWWSLSRLFYSSTKATEFFILVFSSCDVQKAQPKHAILEYCLKSCHPLVE